MHALPQEVTSVSIPHFRRGTDDDRWVIPELVHNDMYRIRDLGAAVTNRKGCVLDCGAHIGTFTLLASKYVPHLDVLAFEPESENFSLLARNVAGRNGVRATRAAVGLCDGVQLLHGQGGTGRWSLVPRIVDGNTTCDRIAVSVPVVAFDRLLREINATIIKLDLEGYEAKLLNSIPMTLLDRTQILIVETHHIPLDHQRLRNGGFRIWFEPYSNGRHFVYRRIQS